MTTNDIFDPKRFATFLQRYLYFNLKGILIAFAAICGVLIFFSVVSALFGGGGINQSMFVNTSCFALFMGGIIVTSMCFAELHKPEKSILFLTLPASRFEKVLAAWVSTTLLFIVATICFFHVAYFIASGLAFILVSAPFEAINLFDDGLWTALGAYWIAQPIFFLGAIYFKGFNFIKTLLTLFVIQFVIGLLVPFFGFIAFGDLFFGNGLNNFNWESGMSNLMSESLLSVLKFTGTVLFPLFLLIVSYVRFNEREA